MAIYCYTGVPGAGKTHHALKDEVIPALKAGQGVCHNIEGVDTQKLAAYVGCDPALIRFYTDEQLNSPDFWPRFVSVDATGVRTYDDSASIFKKGDLLVVDEARRFFGVKTCDDDRQRVLEYHRHWVSEQTGFSSNIVLITQLYANFHITVRGLCKNLYDFQKLEILGQGHKTNKRRFEEPGEKPPRRSNGRQFVEFDPEVFTLYHSYGSGEAKENKGQRRSVWQEPRVRIAIAFALFAFMLLPLGLWWTTSRIMDRTTGRPVETPPGAPGAQLTSASTGAAKGFTDMAKSVDRPRIMGVFFEGDRMKVLLQTANGAQVVDSADFGGSVDNLAGTYQGEAYQWR